MTSIHVRRLAATVARTTSRVVNEARRKSGGGHIDPDALATMRLPWFAVRADTDGRAVGVEEPATVFIYDDIGGSLGVQASDLVQEIEAITAPAIKVRINSPGGSVFDAIAIYNAFNHHPARITTYVDSMAASAASVIAMAGDEVIMMPGSQMMVHDASAHEDGNAEEHRKLGTFLDRQSDNIAGIYARHSGDDVEHWRMLMLDETWAFAEEAVALGLATRVEDPPVRPDPEADAELMSRSFDMKGRYRYTSRREAPDPGSNLQQRRNQAANAAQRAAETPAPPALVSVHDRPLDRAGAALARRSAIAGRQERLMALDTEHRRLPFSAQMRAELVERDGKTFHRVQGYASVFDTPYPMWDEFGPYDEVVVSGAADETLAAKPQVVFLANHGGLALANTRNGTLELSADRTGLHDIAWLNPERVDASDLAKAVADGTVAEQSFAFYITDGVWNMDFTQFRINAFDIDRGDVSAVNYGANPATSIAARQREIFAELRRMSPGQARAAARILDGIEDTTADPDEVRKMIHEELTARMDGKRPSGTSLVHRWATLMGDDQE